jgi:hypothetical protein
LLKLQLLKQQRQHQLPIAHSAEAFVVADVAETVVLVVIVPLASALSLIRQPSTYVVSPALWPVVVASPSP